MKNNKHLSITFFLVLWFAVLSNTSYAQIENETKKVKKVYHEISYQPFVFFTYSCIRDFKGKFNVGAKAGLIGLKYTVSIFEDKYWFDNEDISINVIYAGIFTRNLFLKEKNGGKFIYDIGGSFAWEFFGEDIVKRFSGYIALNYNFGKFMIGVSVRVSTASIFTKNNFEFPYIDLIPLIVTYRF